VNICFAIQESSSHLYEACKTSVASEAGREDEDVKLDDEP